MIRLEIDELGPSGAGAGRFRAPDSADGITTDPGVGGSGVCERVTPLKYYLDVSKGEQIKRLEDRKVNPLKQWKLSPIDLTAVKHWKAYSAARNSMLGRTSTNVAPWHIVHADDKRAARLNLIKDILARCDYAGKRQKLVNPDGTVFAYAPDCVADGRFER